MKSTFSPKQVARAFDVSESSLKRWCDRDMIATIKTAGGHRRVSLPDVIKFAQDSNYPLVRPELLGLPALTHLGERDLSKMSEVFLPAMADGDYDRCLSIVTELFTAGRSMAEICDEVIARSVNRAGDLWECGEMEVYQERLGCEICGRLIDQCRHYVAEPNAGAPLAIGGTPAGDPYSVATQMAELVLREAGWRAVSLGSNLPLNTVAAAVRDKSPRLLWLSASVIDDTDQFLAEFGDFQSQLPAHVVVVVGGRALTDPIRHRMKFSGHCDNMQQLSQLATQLIAS